MILVTLLSPHTDSLCNVYHIVQVLICAQFDLFGIFGFLLRSRQSPKMGSRIICTIHDANGISF